MKDPVKIITFPLYYGNGPLHLGHAFSAVIADFLVRSLKQTGQEVCLLGGCDQHGLKIQRHAAKEKKSPYDYCRQWARRQKHTLDNLGINIDYYIETCAETHVSWVRAVFEKLKQEKRIYRSTTCGYYCQGCERYLSPIQEGICEDHLTQKPEWKSQQNWFFKDTQLSITRSNTRWGVPISNQEVVYVWVDALLAYLEVPGELIYHVIGKDISRFHQLHLESLAQVYNKKVGTLIIHHHIVSETGQKLSKSGFFTGSVDQLMKNNPDLPSDAYRLYLLSKSLQHDFKFSLDQLKAYYNSFFINKLANCVSRVVGLDIPSGEVKKRTFLVDLNSKRLLEDIEKQLDDLNKKITEEKAWLDSNRGAYLNYVIQLQEILYILAPVIPLASKLLTQCLKTKTRPVFKKVV